MTTLSMSAYVSPLAAKAGMTLTPMARELENGVVNFYAHYVLADIDPDTGVETDFFGLPLMLCAGAAVLGCKNRKKEEDE